MNQPTHSKQARRWISVVAWLLLFIAMVAIGMFAGYRSGYSRGYASGANFWLDKPLEARTYDVGDLAIFKPSSPPDVDYVSEWLGTIHYASWDDLGGPGTIEITGPTEIKINHTAEMHEIIAQVFESIRAGRREAALKTENK